MTKANRFDAIIDDLDKLSLSPGLKTQISTFDSLPLNDLYHLKTSVEDELSRLFHLLHNEYQCDLDSPLVTEDGFPRDDVDVLQVRLLRRSINMLRNDLKRIIDRCDILISKQFQNQYPEPVNSTGTNQRSIEYKIPFAVVSSVAPNSPSSKAGIQVGDKWVRIGNINAANHQKLAAVSQMVRQHKDQQLELRVLRNDGTFHDLILIPTTWDGSGFLGCQLLEL
ncbi:HDL013Cp [Eremothecium sinecaudum]|uniref:Probable 26S proteasome regulatory subunit p27 n=1 Tax=Eremothecium sinecaudum TaxID=45286 RepID=A0A120K282_9SACH|nr:HDL013Cp [Eremothecium sinecaudum]AMD20731.1 HDL013Cp [Eremothecium sinecaudum]